MKLKLSIYEKLILYLLLNVLNYQLSNADCGLPAIPFNAQIDNVKSIYYEGESVEYHCELDELKLFGNNKRTCIKSRWEGSLPKCGMLIVLLFKC